MKQHVKEPLVKAILIDPFKGILVDMRLPVKVDKRWRDLLDAQYVECVRCVLPELPLHAVWIDESGFLRDPQPYPQFKISGTNADRPYAGYGILTCLDAGGYPADVIIYAPALGHLIQFEHWNQRLSPDNYIPQLLRLYLPWP